MADAGGVRAGVIRTATALALAGLATAAATPAAGQIYTRRTDSGVVEATNIPGGSGYRLVYPGKGHLIHSRGFRGNYTGEFNHIIESAAQTYGVAVALVHAVIRAESSYDQFAISSKGARGLMQLMPATARRFGVTNSFDAKQNVFAGTRYLRILLDMFNDQLPLALAAYNAGENAVKRWKGIPPYKETRSYVEKIQSWLPAAIIQTLSFVPRLRPPEPPARVEPAVPRVYYKFRDSEGRLHVSSQRPAEGVPYTMIRALR